MEPETLNQTSGPHHAPLRQPDRRRHNKHCQRVQVRVAAQLTGLRALGHHHCSIHPAVIMPPPPPRSGSGRGTADLANNRSGSDPHLGPATWPALPARACNTLRAPQSVFTSDLPHHHQSPRRPHHDDPGRVPASLFLPVATCSTCGPTRGPASRRRTVCVHRERSRVRPLSAHTATTAKSKGSGEAPSGVASPATAAARIVRRLRARTTPVTQASHRLYALLALHVPLPRTSY